MSKQLDFTGLNRIAYKGFEDQPEERDSLLQAGYSIVNEPLPFDAGATAQKTPSASAPQETHKGTPEKDYKRLYRMAFDFHKRHSPPTIDRAYWRDHVPGSDDTPGAELDYWRETVEDASKTASASGNDPLLVDLLAAILGELEREYKHLRETA